ncbi:hypothetical protein ASZ90_003653 [hydrocarbon metagenome]|uniref:Uncharacterized protein n=1 Tax=hydrocarbon metagenome TaxID=938273 RepID=A0A0W8G0P2_9ZZZZ
MSNSKIYSLQDFKGYANREGNINLLQEKVDKLLGDGVQFVIAEIYGADNDLIVSNKINLNSFIKIKEMQSLPDAVVLEFLISKGKLKNSDFINRIKL